MYFFCLFGIRPGYLGASLMLINLDFVNYFCSILQSKKLPEPPGSLEAEDRRREIPGSQRDQIERALSCLVGSISHIANLHFFSIEVDSYPKHTILH